MEQSKKEFLSMLQGVRLSKTQSPTTAEERERTKVVPYASDIGSVVCYVVYRTGSVPCHESVKGYKNDPGTDHWTAVEIVLGVNMDRFLNYGGDKEFGVKGYDDASFNTYPNDSE